MKSCMSYWYYSKENILNILRVIHLTDTAAMVIYKHGETAKNVPRYLLHEACYPGNGKELSITFYEELYDLL